MTYGEVRVPEGNSSTDCLATDRHANVAARNNRIEGERVISPFTDKEAWRAEGTGMALTQLGVGYPHPSRMSEKSCF